MPTELESGFGCLREYSYKSEMLCADSLVFAHNCSSKLEIADGHRGRLALLLAITDYFKSQANDKILLGAQYWRYPGEDKDLLKDCLQGIWNIFK